MSSEENLKHIVWLDVISERNLSQQTTTKNMTSHMIRFFFIAIIYKVIVQNHNIDKILIKCNYLLLFSYNYLRCFPIICCDEESNRKFVVDKSLRRRGLNLRGGSDCL